MPDLGVISPTAQTKQFRLRSLTQPLEAIMKHSDVEKIHAAGLITQDQRDRIVAHFGLEEEGSRFLTILCSLGAVLVGAGVVLLISANWEAIPRAVKIAGGLLLMLSAHAGGYYLREVRQSHAKVGEALHLIGAGLFLANIALIGQIYNLSSRPPNAFLLWWLGIAALPWLLRSEALHIVSLCAFATWFCLETNQRDSVIYFSDQGTQFVLYALVGLVVLGAGTTLRRTAYGTFAASTENLGLLGFQFGCVPLSWDFFYFGPERLAWSWVFWACAAGAALVLGLGLFRDDRLTRQWQLTWFSVLVGGILVLGGALWVASGRTEYRHEGVPYEWFVSIVIFLISLVQIQVGIQVRSRFYVNLGVVAIAVNMISLYVRLIGSMAFTGLMFVVSGALLIGLAVFLEKQRRSLLRRIRVANGQTLT